MCHISYRPYRSGRPCPPNVLQIGTTKYRIRAGGVRREEPHRRPLTGTVGKDFPAQVAAKLVERYQSCKEVSPSTSASADPEWISRFSAIIQETSNGQPIGIFHDRLRARIASDYPREWAAFCRENPATESLEFDTLYELVSGRFFDGIGDIEDLDLKTWRQLSPQEQMAELLADCEDPESD